MSISINGNGITSANIADGAITNADIADDAITDAKLASGGGKVLQVVQGTYSTQTSIATTTYTATGLSLSITPSLATSKILVMWNIPAELYVTDSTERSAYFQSYRDDTALSENRLAIQGSVRSGQTMSGIYLDSPSSTSALTYNIKARASDTASSSNITAQRSGLDSTITLMEIGV